MKPARFIIADGTSIIHGTGPRYTVYTSLADARAAAIEAAFERGSDRIAVYSVETSACLFTVTRSDHGTRARSVACPVPFAPDGGSWLDQRDGTAATYVARHVCVPTLDSIRAGVL